MSSDVKPVPWLLIKTKPYVAAASISSSPIRVEDPGLVMSITGISAVLIAAVISGIISDLGY